MANVGRKAGGLLDLHLLCYQSLGQDQGYSPVTTGLGCLHASYARSVSNGRRTVSASVRAVPRQRLADLGRARGRVFPPARQE